MSINTLLVEDHAIVRQGVAQLLKAEGRFKIVGETGSGVDGVELARQVKPDVVVLDVGLPDLTGADAARQMLAQDPDLRIVALSAFSDRQHVLDMLRAGASAYIVKDSIVDEVVEAIQTVVTGGRFLSPSIAELVLSSLVSPNSKPGDALTPREREVLRLLADGKAMKQAAVELNISTKTVETHRRAIMEKLQLFSVAELTKHAIREGYCTLD